MGSHRTFQKEVPIESIVCPPQAREHFDPAAQAGLDLTVKQRGIEVPLLLRRREGKLYLWDGARRLRAAVAAGLKTVPALIEEGAVADADVTLSQVILNCQREDLTPLEKARAIDSAMKSTGTSATQIAGSLGISNATVTRLLALLTLPEEIQARVQSGEIAPSSAYELSRIADPAERAKRSAEVANGTLSRDKLTSIRKSARRTPAVAGTRQPARLTAKMSGSRSVTVCAAGLTLESFVATLEELLGRARQARTKGLQLATFLKILRDQSKTVDPP
jgi:ParB family chromosome partitioning protein